MVTKCSHWSNRIFPVRTFTTVRQAELLTVIWESRSRYFKLSRYNNRNESLNVSETVRKANRKISMKPSENVQMVKLDRIS